MKIEFFSRWIWPSIGENVCSPKAPGPNWRGVLIRAPLRASLGPAAPRDAHGAFGVIPICGYYFVDVTADPAARGVVLVALDPARGNSYRGEITLPDDDPVVPPPRSRPVPKKQLERLAVGRYFNANLLRFVALPPTPAVYRVHAEYKGHVSNEVTIELYEPWPER